jgi:hypothetical protein
MWTHIKKKPVEINFICTDNTEIYCIFKTSCISCFIFNKMPFISQFFLFLSNNTHIFHKTSTTISIPIQSFGIMTMCINMHTNNSPSFYTTTTSQWNCFLTEVTAVHLESTRNFYVLIQWFMISGPGRLFRPFQLAWLMIYWLSLASTVTSVSITGYSFLWFLKNLLWN